MSSTIGFGTWRWSTAPERAGNVERHARAYGCHGRTPAVVVALYAPQEGQQKMIDLTSPNLRPWIRDPVALRARLIERARSAEDWGVTGEPITRLEQHSGLSYRPDSS